MAEENKIPKPGAVDPAYDTAKKSQLNAKADVKNRVELIKGREVLTCGARKKKGPGFCKSTAGAGTQHPGYGRCKYCGGSSTGPKTEEGKAAVANNPRKHGFYSSALSPAEQEAYEEELATESMGLQHEIYMLKAKLKLYLVSWRKKWDSFYNRKLAENYVKYKCENPECKQTVVKGELEGKPGYCFRCHDKRLVKIDSWVANRTDEEAEKYADTETRVWYSEGDGARSYYHAGSLEDKTLDRALNTLGRLIEKHARLNPDNGDDLLGQINEELKAASKGKISISWGGEAQARQTL
jgi:DNA-directed RNA polymerase subunit RPC12/RpoP